MLADAKKASINAILLTGDSDSGEFFVGGHG
jgi:hypothetical protein